MKVSTKIYGAVGLLAVIGVLVAGAGTWYVGALGEELSIATEKTAIKLDLVSAARSRTWEMTAALRGMFINANLKDDREAESNSQRWDAAFKRLGEQIVQIRPLLSTDETRRKLAEFESSLSEFEKLAAGYKRLCRDHKFEQVADLIPKVQAFADRAGDVLDSIETANRQFLKDSQERAVSLRSQSLLLIMCLSCLLLAGVGLSVFVVRDVNRILKNALSEISEGARQVASAASQVSSSSQSLAQGSSEQAAALEETSASTAEINSMASRNTENSRMAADLVTSSKKRFVETNQFLDQTVVAMGEINSQSGKVSKIIKTIDEIAFQTNILALNAAVEAARAGEAGLGFSVVAGEVRNLAQRCAQAAQDTAGLIEESIAKSSDGKVKVDQVAAAILAITEESGRVKTLVDEVNLGSQEQSRGIEQIGRAITQMEQVTQTTAATAQQSAAAAEQLTAQSESLNDVVDRLSALVGGDSSGRSSSRT